MRALWDRQANRSFRPVDENALSDHVRLFLRRELVERGLSSIVKLKLVASLVRRLDAARILRWMLLGGRKIPRDWALSPR